MTPMLGIMASGMSGNLASGAYASIATVTLGSATASVTFSSIPSTYTHLQIRAIFSPSVTGAYTSLRFNSDTGANYTIHKLSGNGSAASAAGYSSRTDTAFNDDSNGTTSIFGAVVCDILDYANTSKYKTQRSLYGVDLNGSGTMFLTSGLWQSTTAISTITIAATSSGLFNQYSSFALYGIKGA